MRWKRRRRRGSAGNSQPPPHSAPQPGTGGCVARERGQSWRGLGPPPLPHSAPQPGTRGLCGQRAGAELEGPGTPATTTLGAPAQDWGLCGHRAGAELEGPGRRGGAPAAAKATSGCFRPVLLCTPVVSTGPCKEASGVAFLHPRAERSAVVQGTHVYFPTTELGWPQASVPSPLNALPHPGNMTAILGNIET